MIAELTRDTDPCDKDGCLVFDFDVGLSVVIGTLLADTSLRPLLALDDEMDGLVPEDFLNPFFIEDFLLRLGFSTGVAFTFCAIFDKEAFPKELLGVSEPLRDEELVTWRGHFRSSIRGIL
jgi:hypothetical protein